MKSSESPKQSIPPVSPEAIASDQQQGETASRSMDEYYQLKKSIFFVTVAVSGIITLLIYLNYSLTSALSYLIGSVVGIIYLRMLAKDVEKVSSDNPRSGSGRLAVFAGMIIIATQLDQLQVLPIFLGFITYKFAIIFYILPNTLLAAQKYE